MSLIRRNRGTPVPKDFEHFWNLIKAGCVTAGAVGAVAHPAMGLLSIGAEAINQVQYYITTRRSEEFADDVAEDLFEANRQHKLTVEQIQQVISSEQFNSTLLQARLIATRTHQEEKLEALRNAVLNVALGKETSADRQAQFLALVDRFTVAHLTLLTFFRDPEGHFRRNDLKVPQIPLGTNLLAFQLILSGLPEFCESLGSPVEERTAATFQMIQLLLDDLSSQKLVSLQRVKDNDAWLIPRHMGPDSSALNPLVTHLGEDFLAFVGNPGTKRNQTTS